MHLNDNAALSVAKELTIVAMQNNLIKVSTSANLTAKNVTDFFFATANALSGHSENAEQD